MEKEIICPECEGTGKIKVKVCDKCGDDSYVGTDKDGKHLCQKCWAEKLTDEEINNL